MLQGVEYFHARDIIHRDIKEENILISEGEIFKLCDFGWASASDYPYRNVMCGTYEYMAPEIILQQRYSHRIDIWPIGILAYELVHGHTPFVGPNVDEMFERVLEGHMNIDKNLSESYRKLICACLEYSPAHRPSADCLLGLPFFKPIRPYCYKTKRSPSMTDGGSLSPGRTRETSPIPLRFSHLKEDNMYEARVFNSHQDCGMDDDSEKEYNSSPKDEDKDKPVHELEGFTKYMPNHIEVDFAGRKDVSLTNLGDFIEFDLHLGGIPTYLKNKGASILGFLWWSKDDKQNELAVGSNKERVVTPRINQTESELGVLTDQKTAPNFQFSRHHSESLHVNSENLDDTDENIGEIKLMSVSIANMDMSMSRQGSPRMMPQSHRIVNLGGKVGDKKKPIEDPNLETLDTEVRVIAPKAEEEEVGFFSGLKSFFGFGSLNDKEAKN